MKLWEGPGVTVQVTHHREHWTLSSAAFQKHCPECLVLQMPLLVALVYAKCFISSLGAPRFGVFLSFLLTQDIAVNGLFLPLEGKLPVSVRNCLASAL